MRQQQQEEGEEGEMDRHATRSRIPRPFQFTVNVATHSSLGTDASLTPSSCVSTDPLHSSPPFDPPVTPSSCLSVCRPTTGHGERGGEPAGHVPHPARTADHGHHAR